MRKTWQVFLVCLLITACATPKTLEATGGSRADGTMELSYEYSQFETPVVDAAQSKDVATARCRA